MFGVYYTADEYLCTKPERVRATVYTNRRHESFVFLYDKNNEINTLVSLPARFERAIPGGNINPAHILIKKTDDNKFVVITKDSIGMPIHQSVEEYARTENVFCVMHRIRIKGKYHNKVYIIDYKNSYLVACLNVDNLDVPKGIVDNKYIDIITDDGYTFAGYFKSKTEW